MKAKETPELYTVPQVAERLGVNRNTVYNLVSAKELRAVRIGRLIRVPAEAIDEFVVRGGSRG